MGVRVLRSDGTVREFEDARDWYVTDERVLQIYQETFVDGRWDPEFVIAEFNRDAWEMVEFYPAVPPQPEEKTSEATEEKSDKKGEVYDLS